jgi:Ras-related protein Rab-18
VQEFSRQVSTEEGQKFAKRMGTLFVECSAKTNVGVVDIFEDLVKKVGLNDDRSDLVLTIRF